MHIPSLKDIVSPEEWASMCRSEFVYDIFMGYVANTSVPHWVPSLSRRCDLHALTPPPGTPAP